MTAEFSTAFPDGVRHPHYFHGRLLSADDLRADQDAHHHHQYQLGRAIGAGVVEGLEVSVAEGRDGSDGRQPVLSVTRGLAFNRLGRALEVGKAEQRVPLARVIEGEEEVRDFYACDKTEGEVLGVGEGVYVLVISPQESYQQRAPMSGLGGDGSIDGCGKRHRVEGVKFRLEKLEVGSLLLGETESELARLSKLRNAVAHLCFGTEELAGFAVDPLKRGEDGSSPFLSYGAIDGLEKLGDGDLPLALFYWDLERIQFVDLWSVRRRAAYPAASGGWPTFAGERRRVEGEAMFFQFQAQLEWLISRHESPRSIAAGEYFRYLPPAGLLPIARGGSLDLDFQTFLGTVPYRRTEYYLHPEYSGYPELVDGDEVPVIFGESWRHQPVDLEEAEMVWLYQPAVRSTGAAHPRARAPYLLFASGHMRPAAIARFDVARWDYSNFFRSAPGIRLKSKIVTTT